MSSSVLPDFWGNLFSYVTEQTVKNNLDSKWIDFAAPGNLKEQLCQFEKQAIVQALVENNFNLSKTAKQIGYTAPIYNTGSKF